MHLQRALWATAVILAAFFFVGSAYAQAVTQAGPILNNGGHAPMYMPGAPQGLATVMDSGPAAGGGPGYGLSETLQINRGPGSGPFGTHNCKYDGPTTGSGFTGAHYLCFDSNVGGNGTIAYGALGSATPGTLTCIINGVSQPCLGNQVQGMPSVVGNSQLRALSHSYTAAIVRQDYQAGFGAPPVIFISSASPCPYGDDGGSCVSSADGGSWLGQYTGTADVRDFGASSAGTLDAAAAINNAVTAMARAGICAFLPSPSAHFLISAAGISIPANGCLQEIPGAANGLFEASGQSFNLVTLGDNAVAANVVADGNGTPGALFEFGASSNASVRNVTARNASGGTTGTGVDFGSSTNGEMIGGLLYGNLEGTNGYLATGALISGVTSHDNPGHDIGFNTCYNCKIINNYVYGSGNTNLITTYSPANTNLIISGNTVITDGTLDCIRAGGIILKVSDNLCKGGGILISGSAYDLNGTISVVHGSNVVTGTGTTWTANNYYLNGAGLSTFFYGPDGQIYKVLEIDSDTSLRLRTVYAGTTVAGAPAKLFGLEATQGAIVSNNIISNSNSSLDDITAAGVTGLTVVGNEMDIDNSATNGLLINSVTGANISGNSVNGGVYGLNITGNFDLQTNDPPPDGGEVTVVNGSTAVVGIGTNWSMTVPNNNLAWFQTDESADDQLSLGYPPIQVASVTDDTHLTLASPYTGPNCSPCYYTIAIGLNSNLNVSGGNYNASEVPLRVTDTINSSLSGFSSQTNGTAAGPLVERDVTYNNNYQACTLTRVANIAPGSNESCTIWP